MNFGQAFDPRRRSNDQIHINALHIRTLSIGLQVGCRACDKFGSRRHQISNRLRFEFFLVLA
jgi:hypothetical protein